MNKPGSPITLNESMLEEACGWFIDLNEGELDADGRAQFNQWLRRSPEHVRAYVEIAAAWEDSSPLNSRRKLVPDALIAQTLSEQNVIPLNAGTQLVEDSSYVSPSQRDGELFPPHVRNGPWGGKWRRFRFAVAASLAIFLVAASGGWFYSQRNVYTTHIGEQRSIALEDGSSIELNSRSRLRVRFSATERTVELLEGQALFQIKKDATRPFIVDSDGTRVRAVGTQFDVYRKKAGTIVTVLEGRVAILTQSQPAASKDRAETVRRIGDALPGSGAGTQSKAPRTGLTTTREHGTRAWEHEASQNTDPIFLSAGEQLTVAPRIASRPVRVNVAAATAWRERKLIFNETPLAEAVTEFNRYNLRQLVIEDAALADFHIRGNFPATDPDRLIQFLSDRFGVQVREQDGEIRISRD